MKGILGATLIGLAVPIIRYTEGGLVILGTLLLVVGIGLIAQDQIETWERKNRR